LIAGREVEAWHTSDTSAGAIGSGWGGTSHAPIVRGPVPARPETLDFIDVAALLNERIQETIFEIEHELDGPAAGFGVRLKRVIATRNSTLADVLSEPCTKIRYSDRYLFSPLVVRMTTEMLRGFADTNTAIEIETYAQRKSKFRPRRGRLKDDWENELDRDFVLRHLLQGVSTSATLTLSQGVAHRRRLDFETPRGSGSIFFDQGVGSWIVDGNDGFDNRAALADQLEEIEKAFTVANGPDGTFFAVRLN
jgi:hypothetical protein